MRWRAKRWKLFQQMEAEGGYAKALASGSIEKALAETRAAREKAVLRRGAALWWASTTIPT